MITDPNIMITVVLLNISFVQLFTVVVIVNILSERLEIQLFLFSESLRILALKNFFLLRLNIIPSKFTIKLNVN